jgi:hypothetical protein
MRVFLLKFNYIIVQAELPYFLNMLVNTIFVYLFYQTFERVDNSAVIELKKFLKCLFFKPKSDRKTMENGNFKQVFLKSYDFAFTNQLKMWQRGTHSLLQNIKYNLFRQSMEKHS